MKLAKSKMKLEVSNMNRDLKRYDFSVAIPTLNRPQVLKKLLTSILNQTVFPKEVIIVDDSSNENTEILVRQMLKDFADKKIKLKYVRGGGEGLAQARNIGVTFSTGEIHCNLDDDVILNQDYIEKILRIYKTIPNAVGVAGHITNLSLRATSNATNRVFSYFHTEKDKCRIFAAGISYPVPLTHIIECDWLSGTNSCYKKEILKNYKWDEKLKKYSLCEDMDISCRIQKDYPKSLFMTPHAKIVHTNSQLARIPDEQRIYMDICNHAYFFFKNIKQTYGNMLDFVYGIFLGRLLIVIFSKNPRNFVSTIKAQLYLIKNIKNVKQGIFRSF
jgi:glucosyl-dolichyl phosphate glucuronosyltransferase